MTPPATRISSSSTTISASSMGARPQYYDFYTDNTQGGASGLTKSAGWILVVGRATGDNYVGPGSGTIPVVGVPMSDSSGQWGTVDNYYKQIISGSLDCRLQGRRRCLGDKRLQDGAIPSWLRVRRNVHGLVALFGRQRTDRGRLRKGVSAPGRSVHSEGKADGITAQIVWNPAAMNWTRATSRSSTRVTSMPI